MAERSIAWLVAGGHRRVRYRGVARNQMWLSVRTAAINLRRLINLGRSLGRVDPPPHLTSMERITAADIAFAPPRTQA